MKKIVWIFAALVFFIPSASFAASPIHGNFQFKMGGWYPQIDEEFGGDATPFADVYDDSPLLIGEIEIDTYFWSGFGRLGVGVSAGYSTVEGNVLTEDGSDVEDTTSFSVWPFRLAAIYRLDKWTLDTGFPLVLVGKLGVDLHHWNTRDTNGDISTNDGNSGFGWKWGWHASIGVDLLLDIIDPSSAALFDLNWGVNNTYFSFEWMIQNVDGFGGGGLDLSDNYFLFGINFEY